MNSHIRFLVVLLGLTSAAQSVAQVTTTEVVTPVPQSDAPVATVTTVVEAPSGTTTTQVTTNQPAMKSVMTKLKDGTRIEMDSDGSVYQVYPDGARVAAPDGMNALMDGTVITVKDGKRIP